MSPQPMRRAVYAGSFDPPTNGHLWMIREAQALFDELIVTISDWNWRRLGSDSLL